MEEQKPQTDQTRNRQLRLWNTIIAIAVAAILVFSALASFYYIQAADYKASKYRTQFQIVNEMITFLPVENSTIGSMLDTDLDVDVRRAAALSGIRIAQMLAGDSLALAVMYDSEDERHSAFFSLGSALSGLAEAMYVGYESLFVAPFVLTDDYVSMLKTASGILTTVLSHLKEGMRAGVDGIESPYHVAGDMSAGSIASAAAALDGAVS